MKYYKNNKRTKYLKAKHHPSAEKVMKIAKNHLDRKQPIKARVKYRGTKWIFYILFILLLISIWFFKQISNQPTITEKAIVEPIFNVEVANISSFKYIKKLTIYGSSRAYRTLTIIPEVNAKVNQIMITDGDVVNKGDVLIKLTKPQYQSFLNEAEIRVSNSKLEYKSIKTLYANKLSSKRELQRSKAIYEEDKAKLKIAQDNLSSLTIKAPFNAKIEEVYVVLGEVISSYKTSLLKMIQDDKLIITGFLAESKVNDLLIGDNAKIYFSNNSEADGEIIFIAGDADPDTRTFKVEVLINNVADFFRSGMTAKIEIPYSRVTAYEIKPSYLTLNDQGIVGIKYVENFKVKFTEVEILEENNDKMIVTNLPSNLPIIITGHGFVQEGGFVKTSDMDQ